MQQVCYDLRARHKVMGKRAIDLVSQNPHTSQHSTLDRHLSSVLYDMFQGKNSGLCKSNQKQSEV